MVLELALHRVHVERRVECSAISQATTRNGDEEAELLSPLIAAGGS